MKKYLKFQALLQNQIQKQLQKHASTNQLQHSQSIRPRNQQVQSKISQQNQIKQQLDHEITEIQHFRHFPRFNEVQRSIQILKKLKPNLFRQEQIDQLFQIAARNVNTQINIKTQEFIKQQELSNHKVRSKVNSESQKTIQLDMNQTLKNNHKNSIQKSDIEQKKTFLRKNLSAKEKQIQQDRTIAANFVMFNSGNNLNFQLNSNIDMSQYGRIIKRVIFNFYAKLQKFIKINSPQNYISLQSNQLHLLQTIVLNCKQKLSKNMVILLSRCITNMFKLDQHTNMLKSQVIQLYKHLKQLVLYQTPTNYPHAHPKIDQTIAKNKRLAQATTQMETDWDRISSKQREKKILKEKETKSVTEAEIVQVSDGKTGKGRKKSTFLLHNQWNTQKQRLLLDCYRKTSNFGQIRDIFRQRWPQQAQIINSQALRSKLFKIIRQSVKKLHVCWNKCKHPLPDLVRLDDNRVKMIIYYTDGRQVKLQLIEFYCKESLDQALLRQTILTVNSYIANMEALSLSQPINNQKPLSISHKSSMLTQSGGRRQSRGGHFSMTSKRNTLGSIRQGKQERQWNYALSEGRMSERSQMINESQQVQEEYEQSQVEKWVQSSFR